MNGNIWNSVACSLLLSVSLLACKSRKIAPTVTSPVSNELSKKKAENIHLIRSKDLLFNTLSFKAKAKLDVAGSKNNATMNIRMEKNQRIWVSITALAGIEIARALITPDSIKIRNNFQNVYLKKPFNYIHKFTGNQVNFEWLESILSGNTIADLLNDQAQFEQADSLWVVKGKNTTLDYRMLFNAMMKVKETTINRTLEGQSLKILYNGNFQSLNGSLFPDGVSINSMAGAKIVSIDLEYSGLQRNVPLDFPFTVPGKYEVIN